MQASRKGRSALDRSGIFDQRVRPNLLAKIVLVPGIPVDGADHAESVARRRQKDRDRAGHNQCALVQRLVIVAVEEHEIAAPQHCIGNNLVRRAGAIKDEICLIGSEDLRSMPLCLHRRTLMDEQIAEVHVGIA